VDLSQSSSDLMRLRQALSAGKLQSATEAPVSLNLDGSVQAYGQTGQLKFSDVTVDQDTGSVLVRAVFPNPDKLLYPGLFVRAHIEQGVRQNAILVPQKAVMRNPDGSSMVFLVGADNKVAPRPVTVGQGVQDQWLIDGGLSGGETVVVEGLLKIRPGSDVHPVPVDAK